MTGVTGAAKEFFLASGLSPYAILALMILEWMWNLFCSLKINSGTIILAINIQVMPSRTTKL